jgi:hypothetical protein
VTATRTSDADLPLIADILLVYLFFLYLIVIFVLFTHILTLSEFAILPPLPPPLPPSPPPSPVCGDGVVGGLSTTIDVAVAVDIGRQYTLLVTYFFWYAHFYLLLASESVCALDEVFYHPIEHPHLHPTHYDE